MLTIWAAWLSTAYTLAARGCYMRYTCLTPMKQIPEGVIAAAHVHYARWLQLRDVTMAEDKQAENGPT